MKRHPLILASTALGLLMASAPLGAFPLQRGAGIDLPLPGVAGSPLIFAQAECEEGAPDCAPEQGEPQGGAAPEQPLEEAEPAQKPRKKQREQQAEPVVTPETAPAPARQVPEPAAPQAQPEPEAAPVETQAPAEPEQKPRRKQHEQQAEPAETPETAPAPAEQAPEPAAPQAQPEPEAAPVETQAPAEPEQKPRRKQREQQAEPAATPETTPAPASQPPEPDNDNKTKKPDRMKQAQPGQPVEDSPAPAGEASGNAEAAPVLDSQKEIRREREGGKDGKRQRERPASGNDGQAAAPPPAANQGPPPASDEAAQQAIRPEKIEPVTEERGKRRERAPDFRRTENRDGVDVLKEVGSRVIIELGGRTMVENNDRSRIRHDARDVYYEDLPRGRTRETIERRNGDRIVTIRNRDGDIIQRSRITPEGREYILNYVDERQFDERRDRREWRDPGDELPPMRLNIPRNQYILDSESVRDPDDYYEFLEQPPVEPVQRLYSVQEVKRSARVRDIARRVDLDTLTFDTGSAAISRNEVRKLAGVANALERLLDRNPAETFLIEGHTDAVGSDDSNLALSDERAEAVAEALTDAFGIPPENLTTQGYGEQYLKVDTSGPERQNRRVAIRRITSLVAPVANAE